MNTGGTDTGINVSGTEKSAFFQQVAVNAEAVSNSWNFNAYALIPVGDTEQQLNRFIKAARLIPTGLMLVISKSIKHWSIVAFPTSNEPESPYQTPRFGRGFLLQRGLLYAVSALDELLWLTLRIF